MVMPSRNGLGRGQTFVYEPMLSLRSGTNCPQEIERPPADACGCLLHSTVAFFRAGSTTVFAEILRYLTKDVCRFHDC